MRESFFLYFVYLFSLTSIGMVYTKFCNCVHSDNVVKEVSVLGIRSVRKCIVAVSFCLDFFLV